MFAKKIKNISFVYCERSDNEFVDRIAKETTHACAIKDLLSMKFSDVAVQ